MSVALKKLYNKSSLLVVVISALYLLLAALLVGFKTEQLVLVILFNVFYFLSSATRKFILGFSVFIVYWIIFDFMKVLPNYMVNPVHIQSLYFAEKNWFGILLSNGSIITPNEYWQLHHYTALDILSGFFYLCWVPIPLLFAGWLFFKNKALFLEFTLSFLLVNLIGFVIYYIYPAAPPWYVHLYGFHFNPHTPGNTANLARFDEYFHVSVFKSLYAQSSNVFAAMPSLHSSYPLIVLYYGIKGKLKYVNILFAIIMVGIWFAAVYTSHHYILDVVGGILCAIFGIMLFQSLVHNNKSIQKWMANYLQAIS